MCFLLLQKEEEGKSSFPSIFFWAFCFTTGLAERSEGRSREVSVVSFILVLLLSKLKREEERREFQPFLLFGRKGKIEREFLYF
jgi:hypothetical protein